MKICIRQCRYPRLIIHSNKSITPRQYSSLSLSSLLFIPRTSKLSLLMSNLTQFSPSFSVLISFLGHIYSCCRVLFHRLDVAYYTLASPLPFCLLSGSFHPYSRLYITFLPHAPLSFHFTLPLSVPFLYISSINLPFGQSPPPPHHLSLPLVSFFNVLHHSSSWNYYNLISSLLLSSRPS